MALNGESIGVGITTRNRSNLLRLSLSHFEAFSTIVDKLVVVDDSSGPEHIANIEEFLSKTTLQVDFKKSTNRLGISGAKNACLYHLQDMDHVFLFDDDAWPQQKGWEEYWINCSKANGLGHSMWIVDVSFVQQMSIIGDPPFEVAIYNNCLGLLLYFSKECLEALGGYPDCPNVYGYEHAQMSKRAALAGFTPGGYPAPMRSSEFIYSTDISYSWNRQEPPLGDITGVNIQSSVTYDEVSAHVHNAVIMNSETIFIPISDPQLT